MSHNPALAGRANFSNRDDPDANRDYGEFHLTKSNKRYANEYLFTIEAYPCFCGYYFHGQYHYRFVLDENG
jgi:hypothetical protein